MKLDRTRPYGTITGSEDGACFEQDGRLFDHVGEELYPGDSIKPPEPERQILHAPKK